MNYELNEEKSKCLECGDTIEYGRQDRKYCCESCKNRHNNRKAREKRGVRLKILSSLERNYTILKETLDAGVTSVSVMELKTKGFEFEYFTSCSKVRRRDVIYCFDITYSIIADMVINITKIAPILSSTKHKRT